MHSADLLMAVPMTQIRGLWWEWKISIGLWALISLRKFGAKIHSRFHADRKIQPTMQSNALSILKIRRSRIQFQLFIFTIVGAIFIIPTIWKIHRISTKFDGKTQQFSKGKKTHHLALNPR
jgi:hypothetical protein